MPLDTHHKLCIRRQHVSYELNDIHTYLSGRKGLEGNQHDPMFRNNLRVSSSFTSRDDCYRMTQCLETTHKENYVADRRNVFTGNTICVLFCFNFSRNTNSVLFCHLPQKQNVQFFSVLSEDGSKICGVVLFMCC